MVNRPNDYDITTPTGASSPRAGDDEIRKIKEYQQNAWRDIHAAVGVGVTHRELYGTTILASTGFTGNLTGNVVGNLTGNSTGAHNGTVGAATPATGAFTTASASGGFTGDLTGNASTASALQTPRNIVLQGDADGLVSFDGSDDVTIVTTVDGVQPNSVQLGRDTTGQYAQTLTGTADEVVVSSAEVDDGTNYTISLPGTINADTTGNAATATALETSRTIGLSGDVAGSASFDGTGNTTIVATIQPNSVALGTDTSGAYVETITGTSNEIEVTGAGTEGRDVTIGLPGTINANTTGNAATATTATSATTATTAGRLTTARTITLAAPGGDGVTGSVSFDGSNNVTINTTLVGDVATGTIENANALSTARNFSITGDATAAAISFNGTSDVALSVTLDADTVNNSELDTTNAGATGQFLQRGSGNDLTWATVTTPPATNLSVSRSGTALTVNSSTGTNVNLPAASTTQWGVMTDEDKTKLDGIAAGAQVNVATNLAVGGSANSRTITSSTGTDASLDTASTSNAGLMSTGDKSKLDGVATNANNYSHPSATARSINTSGAAVLDVLTVNNQGHVTNATTRNLTPQDIAAATVNHVHSTFDRASSVLSGDDVFSNIVVEDGIVTGVTTRSLTAANIGAAATSHTHNASAINAGTLGTARLGSGTASTGTFLRGDGSWTRTLVATLNATDFCLTSDERLKSDIEDICYPLDKVNALRGVTYKKDGEQQLGVIAQEIEKVLPEVVKENDDGYKTVSYNQIIGVLIGAVQELSAQVEELKNDASK